MTLAVCLANADVAVRLSQWQYDVVSLSREMIFVRLPCRENYRV